MALILSGGRLNRAVSNDGGYGNFSGRSEVIDNTRYYDWSGYPSQGQLDPKLPLWDGEQCDRPTIAQLIKSSSAVQTVLAKFARQEADIATHVVRRVDECTTDRVRPDEILRHKTGNGASSPVAMLAEPVPGWRWRQWRQCITWDHRGHGNLILLKWRADADGRVYLLPIDPSMMEVETNNRFEPDRYIVGNGTSRRVIDPSCIEHLKEHPLCPDGTGTSPLWSLSDAISELRAATQWRQGKHENGWDVSGVIETETDAEYMSDGDRNKAEAAWNMELANSRQAGKVSILQPGQRYKPVDFDPRDMEYIEIRDLTLAEVARRYGCAPSQVGLFKENSGASYDSSVDQRRSFVMDCIAPNVNEINEMLTSCLREVYRDDSLEVVSDFGPYLRADPEKHAEIMAQLVREGILSIDEARKEMGRAPFALPTTERPNPPLNSLAGNELRTKARESFDGDEYVTKALTDSERSEIQDEIRAEIARHVRRWRDAIKTGTGAGKTPKQSFNESKFADELSKDLRTIVRRQLRRMDASASQAFGADPLDDQAYWLRIATEVSENTATSFVSSVQFKLTDEEAAEAALNLAESQQSAGIARSITTHADGMTSNFAAKRSGLTLKQWATTSANPRDTHVSISGETVPIDERFSNGARWPGDRSLPVNERAGCECELRFI